MKKINKTLLLASTFLVSSSLAAADKSYADGGYDLNVDTSTSTNDDKNQSQTKEENQAPEALENQALESEAYQEEPVTYESTSLNQTEIPQDSTSPTDYTLEEDSASFENEEELNNEENTLDLENEEATEEANLEDDKASQTEKETLETIEENQETSQTETEDLEASKEEASEKENFDIDEDVVIYDSKSLDDVFSEPKNNSQTTYTTANTRIEEAENKEETEDSKEATEETQIEKTNYYAPKGTGVIVNEGNSTKYYENNKLVKNAQVIVNDKFYNIDGKGNATNPKSTWSKLNNNIYYVNETGSITKGIRQVKDKKYYFNKNGILQLNKKVVTGESFYEIGSNGAMIAPKNSWLSLNKKRYYNDNNGKLLKGIAKVKDTNYYFDNNGILTGNKKLIAADKYYIVDQYGIATNPVNVWFSLGNNAYKSDENGKLTKGAKTIDDKTYVFDSKGRLAINKSIISAGKFYQANNKGVASLKKNQWVEHDGKKYHTNENGYVKEGVWKIDDNYYYFTQNGLTANKVITQKGVVYTVDQNGVATKQDNNIAGEKSVDKVMEWMFRARSNKMTYDMGPARTSSYAADCSSAVYRALIHGGFLPADTWIGNTETLFKMGAKGTVMYEIREDEIQHGDIFVAGTPGGSIGAAGHTGFILNPFDDTIIHMNYGARGVSVTPRKGYMGDRRGLPVKYYRLVGASSTGAYLNSK